MSEAEVPVPIKVPKVVKNDYELNETDKVETVYERLERSTFFKNEQFRGFIYQ